MRQGILNGRAILTEDEVREAREMYKIFGGCQDYMSGAGHHCITSVKKLADEYGIKPTSMHDILSRKTWKHVE